jgi:thiosulfate dehydrogenase
VVYVGPNREADDKMKSFLLGLLLGVVILPVVTLLYFVIGHPSVAVADAPLPLEAQIVQIPMEARVNREAPKAAPIEASASNLEIGAHVYREQCATCHGLYGRPSPFGGEMYPQAPQLWEPHRNGTVGVSDDPPGETYWKVAHGIRLTGMPAYGKVLNDTQIWQVSLLLANANKPQAPGVLQLLKQPLILEPEGQPVEGTKTPVPATAPTK